MTEKVKPRVWVVESEKDSLAIWSNITEDSSHRRRTLFTINSHCDDGLYIFWNKNLHINKLDDVLSSIADIPLQTLYPAVAGLVDQIVCIYPWWKNTNDVYSNKTHYLGLWHESLCLCTLGYNETFFNESSCQVIQNDKEIFIIPNQCQPFSNSWQSISMQDVYAQTLKDFTVTDSTILSINLDFFTVDDGISLPNRVILDKIEKEVNLIICSKRVEDENVADSWFQRVLTATMSKSLDDVEGSLDDVNLPLCANKKITYKTHLKSLLSTLNSLSKGQRHQLSSAGLCILSTNILKVVICSGQLARAANLLKRSHSAGKSEISLQMEKLKVFLNKSVSAPYTITIVRSTRFGLVSPSNQNILESLVLDQLKSLYSINDTDIVFHPDLLGGAHGWFKRDGIL